MTEREPFDHEGSTTRRLDRVESEVATLAHAVVEVRGDLRNVSTILGRIESSIKDREIQFEQARVRRELNPVAVGTALVSFMSFLVGGAWLVAGNFARLDERDIQRDRQLMTMKRDADQMERRIYELKGQS